MNEIAPGQHKATPLRSTVECERIIAEQEKQISQLSDRLLDVIEAREKLRAAMISIAVTLKGIAYVPSQKVYVITDRDGDLCCIALV